jgi:hypothetical protein
LRGAIVDTVWFGFGFDLIFYMARGEKYAWRLQPSCLNVHPKKNTVKKILYFSKHASEKVENIIVKNAPVHPN